MSANKFKEFLLESLKTEDDLYDGYSVQDFKDEIALLFGDWIGEQGFTLDQKLELNNDFVEITKGYTFERLTEEAVSKLYNNNLMDAFLQKPYNARYIHSHLKNLGEIDLESAIFYTDNKDIVICDKDDYGDFLMIDAEVALWFAKHYDKYPFVSKQSFEEWLDNNRHLFERAKMEL